MSHAPSSLAAAQQTPATSRLRLPAWAILLLIALATCAAYWPAMSGQILWDDDAHIPRPELRSWEGLARMWTDVRTTQQYYPLLFSWFWVQHKLWGDHMLGYHLVNLLLHLGAAGLVYAILRRVRIPGALLATAMFALHPVNVESVAWVTEQKNTLSAVFYLGAMLAYLNFDETRRRAPYFLALGLFVAAVLSKTVTVTLPLALLVILWWKRSRDSIALDGQRGRLSWKRDVVPLAPFFAVALADGLLTIWVERTVIGAEGPEFELSWLQKPLLAGRAVWFYLAKFLWPVDLSFVYPRWQLDPAQAWQWLFPLAAAALLIACWAVRKRTRGPLAGLLLFLIALFPVLGFLNVFFFRYSYVSDHFPYLAGLGLIVPLAAGITLALQRLPADLRWLSPVIGTALVAVLALLTWRQSDLYGHDLEYFWETTIAQNPAAPMPRTNLATTLLSLGHSPDEAIRHLQEAIRLDPAFPDAYNNLGVALNKTGRTDEALDAFRKAIELRPGYPHALNNLGAALVATGRSQEAVSLVEPYVRTDPAANPELSNTLGAALLNLDRPQEALTYLQQVVQLKPTLASGHDNLGNALFKLGRVDEALLQYQEALRLDPELPEANADYGLALARGGRPGEAIPYLEKAVRLKPGAAETQNNLGTALSEVSRLEESLARFQKAVQIRPDYTDAWCNLAAVSARLNHPQEAVAAARKALDLARSQGRTELASQLEANLSALGGDPAPQPNPTPTLPPP